MSTDETPKSKESEIADNMEAEMEARDESRLVAERSEQQNLTQGMDTGTQDSVHRGVDWRPAFSVHSEPKAKAAAAAPEDPKGKSD
jgi:hypothetical protein